MPALRESPIHSTGESRSQSRSWIESCTRSDHHQPSPGKSLDPRVRRPPLAWDVICRRCSPPECAPSSGKGSCTAGTWRVVPGCNRGTRRVAGEANQRSESRGLSRAWPRGSLRTRTDRVPGGRDHRRVRTEPARYCAEAVAHRTRVASRLTDPGSRHVRCDLDGPHGVEKTV